MPRRILFAIRSKLGDTLISYQCVRAYADANPDTQVTLLTRSAYARLLRHEPGLRVIGFDSRIGMALRLVWLGLAEPPFDVLAVLWGSGPPIALIGRLTRAHRKIAWTRKFAPDIFEEAKMPPDHRLVDPGARTIQAFDPAFVAPDALAIPSLAERYRRRENKRAVGVVPIADEGRRNLDGATLLLLIAEVRRRHGALPVRVFVNPGNAGADVLAAMTLPEGCAFVPFRDLSALVDEYMDLAAWVGTDTGLYHLAAAIGIPATVFFGPTQPHKIVMPRQTNTLAYRLAALGDTHCEIKSCARPLCLHANIAAWSGAQSATPLSATPAACPLRAMPAAALADSKVVHTA